MLLRLKPFLSITRKVKKFFELTSTKLFLQLRQIESDRAISSLNNTIEKLSADNKRLRNTQNKEPRTNVTEKTRREFLKLKEDHKKLRNQYLDVVNRNAALEEELKKCRYQIRLLEEKDLAESISSK